jgi:hypothetical protein
MKRISIYRLTMIGVGITLAVGCSSIVKDPIFHSVTRNVETKELNNEIRSYQVAWLSQALLEPETRNEVARKLAENAPKIVASGGFSVNDATDAAMTAQVLTDLAAGQVGSGMGGAVGSAVFIGANALSLMAGDGSFESTNVVLLPATLDGKTLSSVEQAKASAQQLMVARYAAAAANVGYSFTCEYSCDSFPSLYRMKRKPDTNISRYIYAADDVAIYFVDFNMVPAGDTQVIDSLATGFNVAWRTNFNNDAAIYMVQNPKTNSQGKVEIIPTNQMPSGWTINGDGRFFKTDLGEVFLREVYNTPYMLFGTSKSHPQLSYYNGAVYKYILNSVPNTFGKVILPFHK